MKSLRLVFFLLLSVAATLHGATPFPHETSDLQPDPRARFGTLPNGVRYVVMANQEPKNRVSLRLLVEAGSLFEKENERGLAHFLEHMAFNGSEHYAPDTLVEFFQRMGMSFGGDTNAYTSFDRTVYMLELPDTKEATLAEGFRVFADYAGGLLLLEKEIDKERGIILSEKRTRDSVGFRTMVAEFSFLLEGTRFPERIPIGLAEVIEQAPRERFVDFYNTWYRPERLAVVVVGEIDPAAIEKQIAATFGELKARGPAEPVPDFGRPADISGVRVKFHPEPESPATTVAISSITPYSFEQDNTTNRLKYLPRDLAVAMLNRRLSILAKKENATFTSGRASATFGYNTFRETAIELTCKPEQWSLALGTADQEVRRALEHGFQEAELKDVVASFRNSLEQAVKTAPTRRSESLAGEIVDTLADKDVFTSAENDLALYDPALKKVTPEECLAAFRAAWDAPHRYVMVSGNTSIPGDAVATITSTYETSRTQPVAPPEKIADVSWAYADLGRAGEVAEKTRVEDLDVTLVKFANGVRLNLKKTDFEANRIRISVRLGEGQLVEPKDQSGLAFFASNAFAAGGLGQHSTDDLTRLLAGKNVGVGFRVGGDALSFNASTTRDDLLLQFQLLTAFITDPGYRPEAQRLVVKGIEQLYTSLAHTPSGPLQTEVPRLLANGDHRFGLPDKEVALSRTLEEAKAWLSPQFADGALEVAVVGDIDIDATIDVVAKTFGTLPTRAPKPPLTAERKVNFPDEPFTKSYTVPTEIPKGVVVLYWPTADASDVQRTRRLTMLGNVLEDRLRVKVREEVGGAYSPGAGNSANEVYSDYGFMNASVTVDPAKAQEIADTMIAIAADLHQNGITEEELARAKQPVLTSLRQSARTNQYWVGSVLARAQEKPETLEWSRTRYTDNESISKSDLDALAKQYLAPSRVFRVIVLPASKPATATPAATP